MSALKKHNINDVLVEGFKSVELEEKEVAINIVNHFLPFMEKAATIFSKRSDFEFEELFNYAYIATTAAVFEYKSHGDDFVEFVYESVIEDLETLTNVKERPFIKMERPTFVCKNGRCDEVIGCMEAHCPNKIEKNKNDLLNKMHDLLLNLNSNENQAIEPIINGEVNDPIDFSTRQEKTLKKIKKELY